jgi:hypothetical protein
MMRARIFFVKHDYLLLTCDACAHIVQDMDGGTMNDHQKEVAHLIFQIARLQELAQNAEDREQLSVARKLWGEASELEKKLTELKMSKLESLYGRGC